MEVEKFMDTIDDPQIRNAIRHKYEMGKTWEEVGRECGVTGEAIKKKIQRFLEKL